MLPYYIAFLDLLAKISWPILIYVVARMFRGRWESVIDAIAGRVAELVELRVLSARATFGGKIDPAEKADSGLVLPTPKPQGEE